MFFLVHLANDESPGLAKDRARVHAIGKVMRGLRLALGELQQFTLKRLNLLPTRNMGKCGNLVHLGRHEHHYR